MLQAEKDQAHEAESWRQEQEEVIRRDDELAKKAKTKLQAAKTARDFSAASREVENNRRSVTDPTTFGARTVYFFSLQFEDGPSGEYSFLGRGGNFEVPANGTTGLACTRGARLLELLRLRV